MFSFNEPIQGTKIAEYKESIFKIIVMFPGSIFAFGILIALVYDKDIPDWVGYILWVLIFFLVITLIVKGNSFKYKRKLYYFSDGLSVDENKIPFFQNGQKNIDFFILDDNQLFIKTNLTNFNDALDGSIEKMGFKIEPQFQNNKQELLAFLNNKISN